MASTTWTTSRTMTRRRGEWLLIAVLVLATALGIAGSIYFAGGLLGAWRVHPIFRHSEEEFFAAGILVLVGYLYYLVGWASHR